MSKSFAQLFAEAGVAASDPPAADAPAEVVERAPDPVLFADKVVVRHSRKGRGGRTVTLVAGVTSGIEAVIADLKRQLGVGARLDGDEIVIQGDQRERVARWLESRGVSKVVRG
jgi:translation initiation factor 1